MADLGELSVEITASIDGLTAALQQAQSSIGSFASNAASVFAGVLGVDIFGNFIGGVRNAISSVLDSAGDLQSWAVSMDAVMNTVGDSSRGMADSFGASSSRVTLAAMEAKNEMIDYQETMKRLNEDLAEALKGENIIEEQEALADKLAEIAAQEKDRIQSLQEEIDSIYTNAAERQERRQASLDDRLTSMQEDYDLQRKNKIEKWEQDHAYIVDSRRKEALRKAFMDEIALEDAQFQEKLALTKTQEQRRIDQQNAQDKEADDRRISQLKERIAKEEALAREQQDKETERSNKRIAQLKEENDKKIALLREELDREERMHQEHLLKLKEQSAGLAAQTEKYNIELPEGDPFKAVQESGGEMMAWMEEFRRQAPLFDEGQIRRGALSLEGLGINAKTLMPVIGDIASVMHVDLATGIETVTNAALGAPRAMMTMARTFGITSDQLRAAGAQIDEQGRVLDAGSFFRALEKIRDARFADGMVKQKDTLKGASGELKATLEDLGKDLAGITDKGEVEKGGLLDTVIQGLKDLDSFLKANKEGIKGFFTDLGNLFHLLAVVAETVAPVVEVFAWGIKKNLDLLGTGAKELADIISAVRKVIGDVLKGLKGDWDDFFRDITSIWDRLKNAAKEVGDFVSKAISFISPQKRQSPSLVEQVQSGVESIRNEYAKLKDISLPSVAHLAPQYVQNYNFNSTTKSPIINQNNAFHVQGMASAENVSEFLAFQLEHYGIF